ncbi:aminoglycoside phosphotransferase family protein [Aspergillus homomorphus CBS 101889]|uniref:Kinase-like protein n=1 Tax=Aspergillus homomorphus (strain CBS 101889) TaxID=1450537 RepID=A0A395HVA2_ASPHC|nr:kinase-like protein [Aspergillus homomorphus CBS 101889]RAL11737.1 kinase-like protein [Aspergillus homomorphus CBS 101889]
MSDNEHDDRRDDRPDDKDKQCIACGWPLVSYCYNSHVRLIYSGDDRGVWKIGTDMVLKERGPEEGLRSEREIAKLLVQCPEIPAPKLLHDWVDRRGRYFILEEQVQGEPLHKVWSKLSAGQKTAIADQVVQACQKLRTFTSQSIESVNGGPCYPPFIHGSRSRTQGPFHSDLDFQTAVSGGFRGPLNRGPPREAVERLMERMPASKPYVLSHSDLHQANIIVKNGSLSGIIDWEYAGYYPIWYEYIRAARGGFNKDDRDWKALLRERFEAHGEGHPNALQWWDDYLALKEYPILGPWGRELLYQLLAPSAYRSVRSVRSKSL